MSENLVIIRTMKVGILMPGFGLSHIDEKVLRLQPWNYLVQIARNLVKQGYDVSFLLIDVYTNSDIVQQFKTKYNINILNFEKNLLKNFDKILTPIAIGFFKRKIQQFKRFIEIYNLPKMIGILTTPIATLRLLLENYIKVKLTSTSIAARSVLLENIAFRRDRNIICKYIDSFIVSSNDYKEVLYRILPCKVNIIKFTPQVEISKLKELRCRKDINTYDGYELRKDFTIAYFGPFSEERGALSLIKALHQISNHLKEGIKLIFLIRSIRAEKIKMLTKVMNNIRNIDLKIGFLSHSEIVAKLLTTDLVVLPYRIIPSTIPLAYLEALMVSKPLVFSTDIPGISEHIRQYLPKELLLKATYSVRLLKKVLLNLIEDKKMFKLALESQKRYTTMLYQEMNNQKIEL